MQQEFVKDITSQAGMQMPELGRAAMRPDQQQIENYRRMTGKQRSQIGFELFELGHEMVRCAVRQQYPDWTDEQVAHEVTRRFDLAERIHSKIRGASRREDDELRHHGVNCEQPLGSTPIHA